jgi:pimeloyl-ACP methyl ester carboxylesterase
MDYSAWDKKRQNFSVDKGNLRYLREGKGPTLLLIHGFPTSSWDFAWIFPKLVLEYDCIAADLMGLGSSTTSSSRITIADQVDALEALLKYLDVDQAHLLAHDLGDTVALEFLARKKEGHNDFQWLSCAMLNGGIFQEANQEQLTLWIN